MYHYLNEHPEIFLPAQKELHFFSQHVLKKNFKNENKEVKKTHIQDFETYQALYKSKRNEKAVGDISPSYALYPSSIDYIKKYLGEEVKIIFVVRDPIKRSFSNYLHAVREQREGMGFYEALKEEPIRVKEEYPRFLQYTFASYYSESIETYQNAFKDVKVVVFEELVSDLQKGLKDIYGFLRVDDTFKNQNINVKFNEGGVFSDNVMTRLLVRPNPIKTWLGRKLKSTTALKKLKKKALKKYAKAPPKLDENSERYLLKLFKKEVEGLQKMGVNVSRWHQGYFE